MAIELKQVNILGFGTMGHQLTALFALLGYKVAVWNSSFLDSSKKRLFKEIKIQKKKMAHHNEIQDITFVTDIRMLTPAITIEALPESLEIKRTVISSLPYRTDSPWLFTNSSSYSPKEIDDEADALHFFNPIHSMKIIESTCQVDCMIFDDLRNAGFSIIPVKRNRGFIANYVLFREISAALMLVENYGYDSATIDKVLQGIGRKYSVFDVIDFVGVDVTKSILNNLNEEDNSVNVPKILSEALERGVLGKKNKTTIRSLLDD